MRLKPTPLNPRLQALIARTKDYIMTKEEVDAQRISFAYGNNLSNPRVTKVTVTKVTNKLYGE